MPKNLGHENETTPWSELHTRILMISAYKILFSVSSSVMQVDFKRGNIGN